MKETPMNKADLKRVCVKPFGKNSFEVVSDYAFNLKSYKGVVPKGFKTDGASVPRIFWSIFPPYKSEYFSACVIHDYLCAMANSKKDYELADEVLKQALQSLGLSKFKIFIFYNSCYTFHILKCLLKGIK